MKLANTDQVCCEYCGSFYGSHNPEGKPYMRCPLCGSDPEQAKRKARVETHEGGMSQVEFVPIGTNDDQAPPNDDLTREMSVDPTFDGVRTEREVGRSKGGFLRPVLIGIAILSTVLCGLLLWGLVPREGRGWVVQKGWERDTPIERHILTSRQGWREDRPSGVVSESCRSEQEQKGTVRVLDHYETRVRVRQGSCAEYHTLVTYTTSRGSCIASRQEPYTDRVAEGRSCSSYTSKSNGKVSVRQCASWSTTYNTVTRYRSVCDRYETIRTPHTSQSCVRYHMIPEPYQEPIYRFDPVFSHRCDWVVDEGWRVVRHHMESGTGPLTPIQPPQVGPDHRLAPPQYKYKVRVRTPQDVKDLEVSEAKWGSILPSTPVTLQVVGRGTIVSIR